MCGAAVCLRNPDTRIMSNHFRQTLRATATSPSPFCWFACVSGCRCMYACARHTSSRSRCNSICVSVSCRLSSSIKSVDSRCYPYHRTFVSYQDQHDWRRREGYKTKATCVDVDVREGVGTLWLESSYSCRAYASSSAIFLSRPAPVVIPSAIPSHTNTHII